MTHHPEISILLRRQFGVIADHQLAGVSARTMARACARGEYELLLPGVLRSVAHPMTFEAKAMAVQLHSGRAGALSGPTAARIYGLRQMPSEHLWFRAADRRRCRLPRWVTRVESAWLLADEGAIRLHGCWRVLAPAPMLLTLAELFNDHRFERAAEDAWHLGLVAPNEAAEFLDAHRRRGRRGVARFDRWLAHTTARPRPSQSEFELDVLEAVLAAGLPEPQRQFPLRLATGEVIHLDLAWPEVTLAVEPGHSWWHGGDLGSRTDQARDRACGEVGWHVMRYDESYRKELPTVGKEVRATYELRRRAGPVTDPPFPRHL